MTTVDDIRAALAEYELKKISEIPEIDKVQKPKTKRPLSRFHCFIRHEMQRLMYVNPWIDTKERMSLSSRAYRIHVANGSLLDDMDEFEACMKVEVARAKVLRWRRTRKPTMRTVLEEDISRMCHRVLN
jgi:hypothetical protein